MRFNVVVAGLALGLLALPCPATAVEPDVPAEEPPPRESGLVEETGRRLIQLDATVTGPRETIAGLTREDFELVIGGKPIDDFLVDNLCSLPDEEQPAETAEPEAVAQGTDAPSPPPRSRGNFLFYFDQHHLTIEGRENALDMTRKLVEELIVDGNRAMIVSSGEELKTFAELTDDVDRLLEGVEELRADKKQFDIYVMQEDFRIEEILDALGEGDTRAAIGVARRHQREERWRTDKALRLFSMVLGQLVDLNPPKVVVYYADTMRSNAGEHYLSFFGQAQIGQQDPALTAMQSDSFVAGNAFQRVVEEATSHGIRVYTVQAQGLVGPSMLGDSRNNSVKVRHAQDSLVGLAQESGGEAFLNGVRTAKIAGKIRKDLSCLYLISFDAAGLPEDKPLRVILRTAPSKVKTSVRGQVYIQGESKLLTARLLAAFAAPDTLKTEGAMDGIIIPIGFDDGKYSALVQLAIPGSPLSATAWDLGLSLVSRGKVREDASGHVAVNGPGVAVVFETEMTFAPGPYEIVSVAHETTSNEIVTGKLEGNWPDPNETAAMVGPIAVIQPTAGAFLRGTEMRRSGSLGLGETKVLRTDRPTALIGIVCRAKSRKGATRIERRLVGALNSSADFEPMEVELDKDRCVQIRDVIPAGVMTGGGFRYEVRVLAEEGELASAVRSFDATGPGPTTTGS